MYASSLNIFWSLALEEQFYLAWPLLLALLGGRGLPAVGVCLIGVSLVMRARLLASLGSVMALGVWVYPLGRLEPLALGILLAWGWSRWRSSWPAWPTWTGILAAALGWAAVTGLIRLGTEAGIEIAWFRLWGYPAVDLILAGMLGVVLMAGGGFLAQPALVYLGRISYGLYVFHLMVIALVLLGKIELVTGLLNSFWRTDPPLFPPHLTRELRDHGASTMITANGTPERRHAPAPSLELNDLRA